MKSILWKFLFLVLLVPPTAFSSHGALFPAAHKGSSIAHECSNVQRDGHIASREITLLAQAIPNVVRQNSISPLTLGSADDIGELRGSVTYADGQTTVFGTSGNAVIDSKRQIMILPNGQKIPIKNAEKLVHQVAQMNQVQL